MSVVRISLDRMPCPNISSERESSSFVGPDDRYILDLAWSGVSASGFRGVLTTDWMGEKRL